MAALTVIAAHSANLSISNCAYAHPVPPPAHGMHRNGAVPRSMASVLRVPVTPGDRPRSGNGGVADATA